MVLADLHQHIVRGGVRILGLDPDHGLRVADLPMHHRDPVDRLLISQARAEDLRFVTADARLADHDVPRIDAGAAVQEHLRERGFLGPG